jgi:hypothetical protein
MSFNKYLKYKQKYLDLKKEQIDQIYKASINLEGGSNTSLSGFNTSLTCSNGHRLEIGDCFYIDNILYPNCISNAIFKISDMF